MPIFVNPADRVEVIWDEVASSRKLNHGIIRGKALVHEGALTKLKDVYSILGQRLMVTDIIQDVGIKPWDYLYLQTVAPLDLHQLSVPFEPYYQHPHGDPLHRSPSGFNECP